jgi:hypothetical protein
VARVVKRSLLAAGIAPKRFHLLASRGIASAAGMAGASERPIAEQTGLKSLAVLRRYIRDGKGPTDLVCLARVGPFPTQ